MFGASPRSTPAGLVRQIAPGDLVAPNRHHSGHKTRRLSEYGCNASPGYAGLGRAGRGAYEVMLSWINVCSPDVTTLGCIPYSLIDEADLQRQAPDRHAETVGAFGAAARMVALHDPGLRRLIWQRAPTLLA